MKSLKLLPFLMLFIAVPVMAEMPDFQTLDTNRDNLLSKKEVETSLEGVNFMSADKNKDGSLNKEEYAALVKELQTIEANKS